MYPGYERYWTSIQNEPDTPAWITGNQLISGAIGREALARAIAGTPG